MCCSAMGGAARREQLRGGGRADVEAREEGRGAVATSENPMFLRQRLRERLKKDRERTGRTQQHVADRFGWSPSKVIRIENGKIAVSITDAMAMADFYDLPPEERDEVIALARAARGPSWYAPYKEVLTPELETYIACEESASIVRAFERNAMPGLIQTEEYARALLQTLQGLDGALGERRLELQVTLRMQRQKVLESVDSKFFFILDESVLRRIIGSEAIMRQQRETLLRISELPNVTASYVPFTAGAYPIYRTPYQIFEFDDGDPVAYLENTDGEAILTERASSYSRNSLGPADYLDIFQKLEKDPEKGRNGPAQPLTEESVFGNSSG